MSQRTHDLQARIWRVQHGLADLALGLPASGQGARHTLTITTAHPAYDTIDMDASLAAVHRYNAISVRNQLSSLLASYDGWSNSPDPHLPALGPAPPDLSGPGGLGPSVLPRASLCLPLASSVLVFGR